MTYSPFPTSGGGSAHGGSPFAANDSPFSRAPQGGSSPFTGSSPELGQLQQNSAPSPRLIPGLAMGLVSILLSLYLFFSATAATETKYLVFSVIAWGLAGILGIGSLGWYFTGDAKARAEGNYLSVDWKNFLYWVTLAVLAVAVVLSAIHVALWFGKL